jgi:hypothetical protein
MSRLNTIVDNEDSIIVEQFVSVESKKLDENGNKITYNTAEIRFSDPDTDICGNLDFDLPEITSSFGMVEKKKNPGRFVIVANLDSDKDGNIIEKIEKLSSVLDSKIRANVESGDKKSKGAISKNAFKKNNCTIRPLVSQAEDENENPVDGKYDFFMEVINLPRFKSMFFVPEDRSDPRTIKHEFLRRKEIKMIPHIRVSKCIFASNAFTIRTSIETAIIMDIKELTINNSQLDLIRKLGSENKGLADRLIKQAESLSTEEDKSDVELKFEEFLEPKKSSKEKDKKSSKEKDKSIKMKKENLDKLMKDNE